MPRRTLINQQALRTLTQKYAAARVKAAVGAGAYSSSPGVITTGAHSSSPVLDAKGPSPAFNPRAVSSPPFGNFGGGLSRQLAPVAEKLAPVAEKLAPVVRPALNAFHGIATTAVGAANATAGGIGSVAAAVPQVGGRASDAIGLTTDATNVADAFAKPFHSAAFAGLQDIAGGAADTLSGGYFDYDGTFAEPGQHAGTAVNQMRENMRDTLGRGSRYDTAFQFANNVGDFAAEMAAPAAAGRGINVGAKAIQTAKTLNGAAKLPVVGKRLADAGNWLAGPQTGANMFTQGPVQYYRTGGFIHGIDDLGHGINKIDQALQPDAAAANFQMPNAAPADPAAASLTGPEATQPSPGGGPSLAQQPPAAAPVAETPAPAAEPEPAGSPAAPQTTARPVAFAPAENQTDGPADTSAAQPAPSPAAAAQPAQPASGADGIFTPEFQQKVNQATTPEAQQAVRAEAADKLQQFIANNPEYAQGLKDIQAGQTNTDAAQKLTANMQQYQSTLIGEEFEKLKQANPGTNFNDPSTWASFARQATDTAMTKFNELPMEHKLLAALGMGGGLIGLLTSLFGGGGLGSGLLGALGLAVGGGAAAAGGVFGDDVRAQTGELLNNMANFFGGVNVPTAEQISGPQAEQQAAQKIHDAMNQKNDSGVRGGWAAGQQTLNDQLGPADMLLSAPRELAITSLMGLQGSNKPKNSREAAALLDSIKARHQTARQPNFLYNQVRNKALAEVRENPKVRSLLEARKNKSPWTPALEVGGPMLVPEHLKMFLNPNGSLPAGITEEDLVDNMLRNAYGEYKAHEKKGFSMNIAQKIYFKQAALKAARCWSGYEPVPGKAPYTPGSCRPKGSKPKPKRKKK
ncbi:hypothetical protein EBZ39_01350 [bacterium]|nr:hypothetical protein [bacterium]